LNSTFDKQLIRINQSFHSVCIFFACACFDLTGTEVDVVEEMVERMAVFSYLDVSVDNEQPSRKKGNLKPHGIFKTVVSCSVAKET